MGFRYSRNSSRVITCWFSSSMAAWRFSISARSMRGCSTGVRRPGAHGRLSSCPAPTEGSRAALFPQGFGQLQISPAGAVDDHVFADGIGLKVGHMGQGLLLGLVEIFNNAPAAIMPQLKSVRPRPQDSVLKCSSSVFLHNSSSKYQDSRG